MVRAPSGWSQFFADAFCCLVVTLARTMKRCEVQASTVALAAASWVTSSGGLLCTGDNRDLCGREANNRYLQTVAASEGFYSQGSCSFRLLRGSQAIGSASAHHLGQGD